MTADRRWRLCLGQIQNSIYNFKLHNTNSPSSPPPLSVSNNIRTIEHNLGMTGGSKILPGVGEEGGGWGGVEKERKKDKIDFFLLITLTIRTGHVLRACEY